MRPRFAQLLSRLKKNSVKVLRVKDYVANLSEKEMDIVLQALEENTSCQALYLQALSNDQLDCLGSVLQSPGCKIWAVNFGKTDFRINDEMWAQFAKKLQRTNVTHMYASKRWLRPGRKNQMIKIIEGNQKSSSHQLCCNPSNNAVIKEVTAMWENPSM